jgi:hypothetical protein
MDGGGYLYVNNVNKEELFNLRHASARNAIEHIFGVLKRRFRILLLAPEYSMDIQKRIPAALAAIHNFISIHNPHDRPISSTSDDVAAAQMYENVDEDAAFGPNDSDLRRDMIAQKMWDDYIRICEERGIGMDTAIESDLDDASDVDG